MSPQNKNIEIVREAVMFARTGEHGVPNEKERFTLADVLLAIQKADKYHFVSSTGLFFEYYKTELPLCMECHWNLRKDSLTEQSDSTLQFLADLLA